MAEDKSLETENEEQESTKEEGKYSQEQVNKMMASKAKETERKFQSQMDELTKKFDAQRDELIKKGEERAKMDADQRAKADFEDQRKALDAQQAELTKTMQDFKEKQALADTKEALVDAGLPKELAKHLSDVDFEKRSNNISEFKQLFEKAVADAVDAKVSGKKTPETGKNSQPTSDTPEVTQADWDKMSVAERTAFRQSSPENMKLADSYIHY